MFAKTVTAVLAWTVFCGVFCSTDTACDNGWFGSSCQYKCHCTNNNCDDNGSCTSGSKCVDGWFGPACQYSNIAADGASSETSLIDNDDTTCIGNVNIQNVTVFFKDPVPFTWMRIQFKDSEQLPIVLMQFKSNDQHSIVDCKNVRNATVTNTSMDIHCDVDVAVDEVILKGEGIKSLCSIYISGGRNVALKQTTNQSSTGYGGKSEKAVDGNISTYTHMFFDKNSRWNVEFTQPKFVNRYVLYNRQDCCPERLQGFVLQSFTKDGFVMFNYTDKETSPKDVYNVISVGVNQPVSLVVIRSTSGADFLSLGEVEIYGESACPHRNYGPDCDQMYNCGKESETCFVSTGGCPSGCASGFYGEDCQTECHIGKYGTACLKNCSDNCKENLNKSARVCDPENGLCLHGCIKGYEGDTCSVYTQVKSTDDTLGLKIGIGISCGLHVVAIIIITILVLQLRRVKKSRKARHQQPPIGHNKRDINQEGVQCWRDEADGQKLSRSHANFQLSQATTQDFSENTQDNDTENNEANHYEDIRDGTNTGSMLNEKASLKFPKRKDDSKETNYENQITVADNVRQNVLYENEMTLM